MALLVAVIGLGAGGWPASAQPAVGLIPVLSGLDDPLYVTHSRDGSGRLFVVEQRGRIRVLAPGASGTTLFLDITGRVLPGGERGLLGLAFHPDYALNGRFFVHYSRRPDGSIVVAEYQASPGDPDVADPTETVLLLLPHPLGNHNGGMVEFGPDGFLYVGLGDGGGGNDQDNRSQDPDDLLGKILRLDVDRSENGLPYASPPGNPFAGGGGRPEIFALGLRNPFRFSFDRLTGALQVGDVGQGEREEVDLVTVGGNYGWRVLEGSRCTGLGPAACAGPGFVPPVAEYAHGGSRCAIIGGYAYRGPAATLPPGTYVFGDSCSGEILSLAAGRLTVLLTTGLGISSFGEDAAGELYVVDLGGRVLRLAAIGSESPRATLTVNDLVLEPGDPVRVSARLENPGPPAVVDVYLGALLPDGVTVLFVTGLDPLTVTSARLDGDPAAFAPLAPGFSLAGGLDQEVLDAATFTFTGAELPAGRVQLFLAFARPGTRVDLLSLHLVGVDVEP